MHMSRDDSKVLFLCTQQNWLQIWMHSPHHLNAPVLHHLPPHMLYGCELWAVTKTEMEMLKSPIEKSSAQFKAPHYAALILAYLL